MVVTPKQKATELFNKYCVYLRANLLYDEEAIEDAKECTLIAIEEIVTEICECADKDFITPRLAYWKEVAEEVEKLH